MLGSPFNKLYYKQNVTRVFSSEIGEIFTNILSTVSFWFMECLFLIDQPDQCMMHALLLYFLMAIKHL